MRLGRAVLYSITLYKDKSKSLLPLANCLTLLSPCRSPGDRSLWFDAIRESTWTTRYFELLSPHFTHCNEIVGPLVQCENLTP